MKNRKPALALVALSLACGCNPRLTALTAAPPTAVAALDNEDDYSVRLSQGIALAIECTAYDSGAPCEDATATSADTSIARVLPAFVDLLAPGDATQHAVGERARAVFIFVGGTPGDTTVTIASGDGDRDVEVKVLSLSSP